MLVPSFRFSVGAAVPVTTTSLRLTALTLSAMSPTALSPALTVTGFRRELIANSPDGDRACAGGHGGERERAVVAGGRADSRSVDDDRRVARCPDRMPASVTRPRTVPVVACAYIMCGAAARQEPERTASNKAEHHPAVSA